MPSVDCGIFPKSQSKAPAHVMEKLGGLQSAIHEFKIEEQKSDFQKIDKKLQVKIQDCKMNYNFLISNPSFQTGRTQNFGISRF